MRESESVCDIFKIPSLYSEQEKCLEALFKGKDVYASLPTGYGKSLIFYAAPIVADELFSRPCKSSKIIVISPPRTLIEDQVAYLWSLGLSAIALHDEQSEERLKEVEKGNNQSNHFPHIPEKVTRSLNTIINGKSQTLLSDFF